MHYSQRKLPVASMWKVYWSAPASAMSSTHWKAKSTHFANNHFLICLFAIHWHHPLAVQKMTVKVSNDNINLIDYKVPSKRLLLTSKYFFKLRFKAKNLISSLMIVDYY